MFYKLAYYAPLAYKIRLVQAKQTTKLLLFNLPRQRFILSPQSNYLYCAARGVV